MPTRVTLRSARKADEATFLDAVRRSRLLHRPWVSPPSTRRNYQEYLARASGDRHRILLAWLKRPVALAGVINLNEIVRGCFQNAYLGYYAFEPFAGRGLMREALALAITHAFGKLRLHRLEANIQPGNTASRALVRSLGFRLEGYSPRYLKIAGRWRDHERWAMLAEHWHSRA